MMETLSIAATSPAGLVQMRTFYAGLMCAMGVLFLAGDVWSRATQPALVMMTVTYAAAVAARSWGMLAGGVSDGPLIEILLIEVAGLVTGAAGLLLTACATRAAGAAA